MIRKTMIVDVEIPEPIYDELLEYYGEDWSISTEVESWIADMGFDVKVRLVEA